MNISPVNILFITEIFAGTWTSLTHPSQVLYPIRLVGHLEHLHEQLVSRKGLPAARQASE